MKYVKIVSLITALMFIIINVQSQNYLTQSEVISSGGGESTGANYSNFGVIGETFVANSVTGGNYNTSIGFLYSSDLGVGINEIGAINNLRVFPNPTRVEINIECDNSMPFKTELYNLFGEIVISRSFEPTINVSKLSNGLYFMKLLDKDGSLIYSEKIIKY